MGKRSDFERRPRDFYPTPYKAVLPLLEHLDWASFDEPCCGDGDLVNHLERHGIVCVHASDIKTSTNAMSLTECDGEGFITNPPWDRKVLHPMIQHLSDIAPTWLLLDADWMHTKQAIPYMERCSKIVSVGRVSWLENGVTGKDNCAWYLFEWHGNKPTEFYPRTK